MMEPTDYVNEVFLSYRRDTPVERWVERYFYPELDAWLPEFLPPGAPSRIFFDKNIPVGNHWPEVLKQEILGSRCLIPILSAPYFSSRWCRAEFETMRAREKRLGLAVDGQTTGLIYPVVFCDGRFFPEEVKRMQQRRMHRWALDNKAFRKSQRYTGFLEEMKKIAEDLAGMIERAPAFDPTWPLKEDFVVNEQPGCAMDVPRFGTCQPGKGD